MRPKNETGLKLHIGAGPRHLDGWVNIDSAPYPGVDDVRDVLEPLPYKEASLVFAEHFLEHLTLDEGAVFLHECRRVLAEKGALRLSTPNLDWVVKTQYQPDHWATEDDAIRDCVQLNRGFYGWGHRFLYNEQMLTAALHRAGFQTVRSCRYGESDFADLRNVEGHDRSSDSSELPEVIIVEAFGVAEPIADPVVVQRIDGYRRDTEAPWHFAQYALLSTVRFISRLIRRPR